MRFASFLLFFFLPFQALLGMHQQTTALIAFTSIKQMVVSKRESSRCILKLHI